jgi:putative tryptophan/tyrosine transport system substrate-binding protein
MTVTIGRRELLAALGGAAALWPLAARAQQSERTRRVGMLMTQAQDDPNGRARNKAFLEALEKLGWSIGGNVRIEYRWSAGDVERIRKDAADLAALAPNVILTNGAAGVAPLLQATRTVPVVFVLVADPVGAGFVDSLAHPGGNATGFSALEYGLGGKWLELLKEIAPGVTRAAIVRDPAISAGIGLFGAIQSAAASLGVEVTPVDVRDITQIEHALAAFARVPKGGVVVTASALALSRRDPLIALAAQHKLPAIYFTRDFVTAGGLAAYSPDTFEQYRRAAGYVDRILKGEKPADLPVQAPTKYDLVINLNTAKALGLDVPPSLLARADEVIE